MNQSRATANSPDSMVDDMPGLARKLGVGINKAYEVVREGKIPRLPIHGRVLVSKKAVERFLDQNEPTECI